MYPELGFNDFIKIPTQNAVESQNCVEHVICPQFYMAVHDLCSKTNTRKRECVFGADSESVPG